MATVSVNGRLYHDIQLIAFDKDGTLVEFNHLWAGRTKRWLYWLVQHGGIGRNDLYQALSNSLGFNPQTNLIVNDSPLAIASLPKLYTIAAAVLYQHGLGWLEAEQIVRASLGAGINALPEAQEIQPIGDVQGKMRQLASNGVHIAVITSDDRAITKAILSILCVGNFVDLLVCGDDDIPNKPAPDGLWAAGRQFDIQPSQMLMVGDTASDMKFGRNARVVGCIGIRSGVGNGLILSQEADEVIDSIEEIEVIK